MADVRYVGAGVLASAVGMDKHFMKVVFEAAGLQVGPYMPSRTGSGAGTPSLCASASTALGFPVFVKPARAGSSMGITRVDCPRGPASRRSKPPASTIPRWSWKPESSGREIECAVLEGPRHRTPADLLPGEIAVAAGRARVLRLQCQVRGRRGGRAELPRGHAGRGDRPGPRAGRARRSTPSEPKA